jgi:Zn-finger nucleic acid-binding protein
MHCTTCKSTTLEPKEIEPGLIAAACPQCEGSLISLMNYRYWVDRYAAGSTSPKVDNAGMVIETKGAHTCPKCSRLMTKYQMGLNAHNKLDLCAACDEAWLDKGEWQLLKELDLQDMLPKIFTDAWQRNIRKQKQEASLNERYEKLLSTDTFNQAHTFKQWMYRQPQRDAIKQFLMISPE